MYLFVIISYSRTKRAYQGYDWIPPNRVEENRRYGGTEGRNTSAKEAVRSTKAASRIQSEVGKRANGFLTSQGISSFKRDRGRTLSSSLTTLADGSHNKRHRVNDGHQTGLISGTWKDEGSSGTEWSLGAFRHSLFCFLSLQHERVKVLTVKLGPTWTTEGRDTKSKLRARLQG